MRASTPFEHVSWNEGSSTYITLSGRGLPGPQLPLQVSPHSAPLLCSHLTYSGSILFTHLLTSLLSVVTHTHQTHQTHSHTQEYKLPEYTERCSSHALVFSPCQVQLLDKGGVAMVPANG